MVAYTLPADTNMTAIADGRRCALLAEPRPGGQHTSHPRPGGAVHLTAAGTKDRPRRQADPKRLAFRADLHLSSDGVVRVLAPETTAPRHDGHPEHEAHRRSQLVERLLNAVEQGAPTTPDLRRAHLARIAAMAGFKDWPALFAGVGGRGGEIVVKTLLVWIEPEAPAEGERAEAA